MDPTISVSKGCFVFKNGATRAKQSTSKEVKRRKTETSSVLSKEMLAQPFYKIYSETWHSMQTEIEQLQQKSSSRILDDLAAYIANECNGSVETYGVDEILPSAALMTGINQPDHLKQFERLSESLQQKIEAKVCVLHSRDCPTLKTAIETMVYNFIEGTIRDKEENEEHQEDRNHKRIRRSQCTMKKLVQWYQNNFESNEQHERHSLVVILPDFECFNSAILQDLILILSGHCVEMPFFLVIGVATAVSAIHSTLPYHVTSKIKLRIFQIDAAPITLNEILDKILLSPKYAFHLSGKCFKFLTHIFLYYDFSIQGLIQGFKYCLMEHFFQGNAFALCDSSYSSTLTRIKAMTHDDMEAIRHLLSFRPYVESINDCKRIIAILTDDDYLKKKLPRLLRDCHIHFLVFRCFLEFFTLLVCDLPKCPFGKYRRELYAICLTKEIIEQPEFSECWQMLNFMAKGEFIAKISKAIAATEHFMEEELRQLEIGSDSCSLINEKLDKLKKLLEKVSNSTTESDRSNSEINSTNVTTTTEDNLKQCSSRQQLKDRLLQMTQQASKVNAQIQTDYQNNLQEILDFIKTEIVACHLKPLERFPTLYELFVFTDLASVRRNIIGAPRAALHMALNNPHFYLQCKCCSLEDHSQLLQTLPDLSVAYKLHLECGRMINLYDWLQAFRTVVDDNENDENLDQQILARFTRAVAEMQFLGYIKMSKRKTDHATRLTW